MDCSLPGPSIHGVYQARILEPVAISFSRAPFQESNSRLLHLAGRFLTTEPPGMPHTGTLLSHEKNKIMPLAATWMDLEIIILSEISQRQISSVQTIQFSSVARSVRLFVTPWTAEHQAFLSPTPRVYSNSCSLSWCCHPTISSSVFLFLFPLQSFPASGSFHMSWFFASGGQNIGVSASAPVLPMNTQD